jgi:hypothetical protein
VEQGHQEGQGVIRAYVWLAHALFVVSVSVKLFGLAPVIAAGFGLLIAVVVIDAYQE